MRGFAMKAFIGVLAAGAATPAFAADPYDMAPEPAPLPVVEAAPVVETGGWYIRGDLGYGKSKMRGGEFATSGFELIDEDDDGIIEGAVAVAGIGSFASHKLKGSMSIGGGVGYQINDHFRVDATVDRWFKSDFTGSTIGTEWDEDAGEFVDVTTTDKSSRAVWLLLANAYVDLGTYGGFTPYVGAGIGGAHVKWNKLTNTFDPPSPTPPVEHGGASSWRFAAAAMVGASYCLTDRAKLDVGYRFTHISGGAMFGQVGSSGGPGWDKGFNTHEVRGGLRYALGGTANGCAAPAPVAYEPPPSQPIYK